jgi:mono/diheme cytochrome c family protein
MRFRLMVAIGATVLIGAAHRTAGQEPRPRPPLVIPSLYGGDLYQFYCASCHGREGRGDGPVAKLLTHRPPDLTTIAKRHNGRFPREAIERSMAGLEPSPPPTHGSREMPVWGPDLYALDPDDRLTRVGVANVVRYLESIQSK